MKKTKNFRQQFNKRYDSLVTKSESILEHYTCPETCDAKCCKYSPINFNNREYHEIVRKVDKDSAAILKSRSVFAPIKSGFYKQFPTCVCPLLKESKCSIYKNRPETCEKFPFEIVQNSATGSNLQLRICPLSMIIIRDYIQWLNLSTDHETANLFTEVYEEHKNIDAVSINVITFDEHDIDSFDSFVSWLEKNTEKIE